MPHVHAGIREASHYYNLIISQVLSRGDAHSVNRACSSHSPRSCSDAPEFIEFSTGNLGECHRPTVRDQYDSNNDADAIPYHATKVVIIIIIIIIIIITSRSSSNSSNSSSSIINISSIIVIIIFIISIIISISFIPISMLIFFILVFSTMIIEYSFLLQNTIPSSSHSTSSSAASASIVSTIILWRDTAGIHRLIHV